jgi:hypothetical protein
LREEKKRIARKDAKPQRREACPPRRKVKPSRPQFLCAHRGGHGSAPLREEKKELGAQSRKDAKSLFAAADLRAHIEKRSYSFVTPFFIK